ncbi:capsular polysaccharide biosynthesis protein Cap5N [Clostridium sp. CAG:411]|nr:capsular polysaccharide biosynthesis protein Cap5N [Clostridium sp. CAG:411]
MAKKLLVFPSYVNQRSMIHIDILCECLRLIVENQSEGIFCPQNKEYVSTSEMVREIGACCGRKIHLISFFNGFIQIGAKFVPLLNKVFGSLTYEKALSNCFDGAYQILDFKETIRRTEGKE